MKKETMPSILKQADTIPQVKSDAADDFEEEDFDVEYEDTEIPVRYVPRELNSQLEESNSWCGSSVSSLITDGDDGLDIDVQPEIAKKLMLEHQTSFGVEELDDDVSDTDSRHLVDKWEKESDSQSETDSSSAEIRRAQLRLSSLLAKGEENDDNQDEDVLQFGGKAPVEFDELTPKDQMVPSIQVDVPDHIWQSPEFLKKKILQKEKKVKSKNKKKADTPSAKEQKASADDSSSESSLSENIGSVQSIPEEQLQAPLYSTSLTPSEEMATPVAKTPEALGQVANVIATPPGKLAKKKLGKQQYEKEESVRPASLPEDISRYNPLFYRESKQGPLIDHSYRSKKEKTQAKKERKKQLAEERKRHQEFNKKLDQFFAFGGLAGDAGEHAQASVLEDEQNEPIDTQQENTTDSDEIDIDGTTSDESESSDFFDDDSMDSIEGFTNVKKTSRTKKQKKSYTNNNKKKASNKKKKVEKKRGRQADYEIDDPGMETEAPAIPVDERVEAIFNNKELIFQQYEIPPVDESTKLKASSRGRSKPRSETEFSGPLKGGDRRSGLTKRANSGGNLMVDRRPALEQRRSNSFGSLKRSVVARKQEDIRTKKESGDPQTPSKTKLSGEESRSGSQKLSTARRRPDASGEKKRSNSLGGLSSAVAATRKERSKASKLADSMHDPNDPQRVVRRKRSSSVDGLFGSRHDTGKGKSRQKKPDASSSHEGKSNSKFPSALQRQRKEPSDGSVELDKSGHRKKASREGRTASKSPSALRGKRPEVGVEIDKSGHTRKSSSSRDGRTGSKSPSALRGKRPEQEGSGELGWSGHTKKTAASRDGQGGGSKSPSALRSKRLDAEKARSGSKSPSALKSKRVELGETKKSPAKEVDEPNDEGSPDEALRRKKIASGKDKKSTRSRSRELRIPTTKSSDSSKETKLSKSKEMRNGAEAT